MDSVTLKDYSYVHVRHLCRVTTTPDRTHHHCSYFNIVRHINLHIVNDMASMLLHGWSVSSVSVTLGAGNPDHAAGGGGAGALNADEEQFQLQVRDLRYTSRFTSARLHKCTGVGA